MSIYECPIDGCISLSSQAGEKCVMHNVKMLKVGE